MKMHALFAGLVAFAIATPLAAEIYTYDATGRLTSVGYDNGQVLSYTYDLNGNIIRIATLVDSDLDGMEDSWEVQFFGSIQAADPNGDRDGDGLTELAEFTLGRNPDLRDPDGAAVAIVHDAGSDLLEFTYQRSKIGALFDTFTVELSNDLLSWFSGPVHLQQVGSPVDLGGELEELRFRVVLPVTARAELYVRLLIERKQ